MSVTITRDEWLAEFERVMRPRRSDPGLTAWELADSLGIPQSRAQRMLKLAHRQGRLICGRKPCIATDGRAIMVPCYQLQPKAAKRR